MKSFKNTLIAASLFATTLLSPGVGAQSSTAGSLAISAGTALVVSGSLAIRDTHRFPTNPVNTGGHL